MKGLLFALMLITLLCTGCAYHSAAPTETVLKLDLSGLDSEGLRGPPGGKVALAYEFCIPNTDSARMDVQRIDPSLQLMPNSPGRIGCGKDQCLCIGSTHQKNFRKILSDLASLPYVNEIRRCDFE